jgi:hypothetical protein
VSESPFDSSNDPHAWRLARREAALAERERQVAERERELASRDLARRQAEAAVAVEKQRADELQLEVDRLRARVAQLEFIADPPTSSREVRDESARDASERDGRRPPLLSRIDRSLGGNREQEPSPPAPADRWVPADARTQGRRVR